MVTLKGGVSQDQIIQDTSGGSGLVPQLLTGAVNTSANLLPYLLGQNVETQGKMQPYSPTAAATESGGIPVTASPPQQPIPDFPTPRSGMARIEYGDASTAPVGRERSVGDSVRVGGYPASQILAQAPGGGVPGVDIMSDATGATRQEFPAPAPPPESQDPVLLAANDPALEPAFSPSAPTPVAMTLSTFGRNSTATDPLSGGQAAPRYPIDEYGNYPGLPPMQKLPQMDDSFKFIRELPVELQGEVAKLVKARDYYGKIANSPSPYEKAKQFYDNGGPGLGPRLAHLGASMFSGGKARSSIPFTLSQYLATNQFKQEQAMFDDATEKYHQLSGKLAELQKQIAFKRVDLEEKRAAADKVPASVRIQAAKNLMNMPSFEINEQGQPVVGPNGKPVLNASKLQAIDIYIGAGLIDPSQRQALMMTFPTGARLEMEKKAQDLVHAKVYNKLREENQKLHNEKLKKAMDLDLELKRLLKQVREGNLQNQALDRQYKTAQMANIEADNIRAQKDLERKIKNDKIALDNRLNSDRLAWSKIASLNPQQSMLHGVTPEAIQMAKDNVKMIDLYQSGQLNYLLQAFEEVTGKSGSYGALIGWSAQADKSDQLKIEDRALELKRLAEGQK